jgi:hypothetical protein
VEAKSWNWKGGVRKRREVECMLKMEPGETVEVMDYE